MVPNAEAISDAVLPLAKHCVFRHNTEYRKLQIQKQIYERSKIPVMFFMPHDGVSSDTTTIAGQELVSFGSYNYLGLSGSDIVVAEAKRAIDRFGTSVSASRLVSGEIPLHRELEQKVANFIGVDDCLVYVSGHATNVSTIGHLFGRHDLILHDALIHNSALEGCKLSGAKRMAFRHNDWEHLDRLLAAHRNQYQQALIIIEGIYSMDGDIADLPRFIELKKRYNTYLMVDEAHSIGVLGSTGRGVSEHFAVDPRDVDLWMGTLSKSLASCGGYIAGSSEIVEFLKLTSPGFVYSVGMPPSSAAAAIAALQAIEKDPMLVRELARNSRFFLDYARECGLNTGLAQGTPVVPVVVGDSELAMRLSHALFEDGVLAPPIIAPAVKNDTARLRFFITARHTENQIRYAVDRTLTHLLRLKGACRQ
jgi:8-amino-7-oxononanoate synthase